MAAGPKGWQGDIPTQLEEACLVDGSRHRLMALAAALKSNEDFPKFLKKTAQKLSSAMGQKKGYQHETMDLIHVFFTDSG